MVPVKVEAYFVERLSSKDGKPYKAIELILPGNYKKLVFLNAAEKVLVETFSNPSSNKQ